MRYPDFVEVVTERAGLASAGEAARVIDATVEALGEQLGSVQVEQVAGGLPPKLAAALARRRGPAQITDAGGLARRVGELAGLPLAHALEQAQVVCQVLAELSDPDALAHLATLPPGLAALLEPRARGPAPPPPRRPATAPGTGRTLASGRPGSGHPLSESSADRAHRESLARAAEPHGQDKLSTSHGGADERRRDDLSTGRPGSTRPLSRGD
jgi:uncharacterized protein (DUF2267 family)